MDLTTLRFQRFKRFTQKCFYSDGFNQYLDNGGSLEKRDWKAVFLAG